MSHRAASPRLVGVSGGSVAHEIGLAARRAHRGQCTPGLPRDDNSSTRDARRFTLNPLVNEGGSLDIAGGRRRRGVQRREQAAQRTFALNPRKRRDRPRRWRRARPPRTRRPSASCRRFGFANPRDAQELGSHRCGRVVAGRWKPNANRWGPRSARPVAGCAMQEDRRGSRRLSRASPRRKSLRPRLARLIRGISPRPSAESASCAALSCPFPSVNDDEGPGAGLFLIAATGENNDPRPHERTRKSSIPSTVFTLNFRYSERCGSSVLETRRMTRRLSVSLPHAKCRKQTRGTPAPFCNPSCRLGVRRPDLRRARSSHQSPAVLPRGHAARSARRASPGPAWAPRWGTNKLCAHPRRPRPIPIRSHSSGKATLRSRRSGEAAGTPRSDTPQGTSRIALIIDVLDQLMFAGGVTCRRECGAAPRTHRFHREAKPDHVRDPRPSTSKRDGRLFHVFESQQTQSRNSAARSKVERLRGPHPSGAAQHALMTSSGCPIEKTPTPHQSSPGNRPATGGQRTAPCTA